MRKPSPSPGNVVRPEFYQSGGVLDFVWFTNFTALPAFLYYNTVGFLKNIHYISHRDSLQMEVWNEDNLLGFAWPCRIDAPQILDAARAEFRRLRLTLPGKKANRSHDGQM